MVRIFPFQQSFRELQAQDVEGEQIRRENLPSKGDLLKSKFGRPDKNHSFIVEPIFEHILIILLKIGYLETASLDNVKRAHPLFDHLAVTLDRTVQLDFSRIQSPMSNYDKQTEIPMGKVMCITACALHYDLHIPSVLRYAGGNYTGEYRNVENIVSKLEGIVHQRDIDDLQRVFKVGAPTRMVAESTSKNFQDYFTYGNHASIAQDIEKVEKTMNKEERNSYVLPLPNWLARFIPNAFYTPNGLISKPGKKDRLVFDGSFTINWDSQPVNRMVDASTEPPVTYGSVLQEHIKRIWNLRISYPDTDIFLWDDDVAGCFRHIKHHPDVAAAFGLVINQKLYFYVGQTFGSVFSPANQEPVRRAREQLAKALFDDTSLVEKHRELLDTVRFDEQAPTGTRFAQAWPCSKNQGAIDKNNVVSNTPIHTFVDDALMADIRRRITYAMAASIEALYVILGDPDESIRRNALSLDKFFEAICSPIKVQLGLQFDTRAMTISLTDEQKDKMLKELKNWHSKRQSFTAIQAARLVGQLQHMASVTQWAKFLFTGLSHSVIVALTQNKEMLKKNSTSFLAFAEELREAERSNNARKVAYLTGKLAKMTWGKKTLSHINRTMKEELKVLSNILASPEKYHWVSPIAHKVDKDPDFVAYGDACLYGGGGFSTDLKFWWQTEWEGEIQNNTLLHLADNRSGKLVSINALEYMVIIINYAATTLAHSLALKDGSCDKEYPTLLNLADNTAADSWTRKMCTRSKSGKALSLVLAALMINNPVGLNSRYIEGLKNEIADAISRIHKANEMFEISTLMQDFPQLKSCRRFHPSRELLSHLYAAVSQKWADPLQLPKQLGHFDPAKITTSNSAKNTELQTR